jgi:hypothetical protein
MNVMKKISKRDCSGRECDSTALRKTDNRRGVFEERNGRDKAAELSDLEVAMEDNWRRMLAIWLQHPGL